MDSDDGDTSSENSQNIGDDGQHRGGTQSFLSFDHCRRDTGSHCKNKARRREWNPIDRFRIIVIHIFQEIT